LSETAAAPASAPAPIQSLKRQQSLLFPALFKRLDQGRRMQVFDVGPAQPETLAFFSPFRCRLHFAGLYDDPLVCGAAGDGDRAALVEAFTRAMAIPPGTRFDLCLLWDFPNYLDDEPLKAFSEALRPFLHARTLGHAFAVRTSETRLDNRWYGVDQPHLFTLREPAVRQPRMYPHSQAILINLLTCFEIERGMLLPDGRLEVAMRAGA
jgi:hypothetical protein